jgi:hypothetical protein
VHAAGEGVALLVETALEDSKRAKRQSRSWIVSDELWSLIDWLFSIRSRVRVGFEQGPGSGESAGAAAWKKGLLVARWVWDGGPRRLGDHPLPRVSAAMQV